jgi:UDP-glucuronate 4-epimerase
MRYLITGTAGFIGFHVAHRLLSEGHAVVGVDGITPYYDQALKRRRHEILGAFPQFSASIMMLEDGAGLTECVRSASADVVIHLAAQAGVRYSAENPRAYLDSNIIGTFNLLEALKSAPCDHLIVTSTSSVYGATGKIPFEEKQETDHPISLYAATKKATELLAYNHTCSTGLPITVIRLFTVYGPWGRPDMAIFKFTRNIIEGQPIDVYGFGNMTRDFTYVDDTVESIRRLVDRPAPASAAPFQAVNVGGGQPVGLLDFIAAIEAAVGRKAIRRELPMQPGDVPATYASTELLERLIGFKPQTPLAAGVEKFVAWYREYYRK